MHHFKGIRKQSHLLSHGNINDHVCIANCASDQKGGTINVMQLGRLLGCLVYAGLTTLTLTCVQMAG